MDTCAAFQKLACWSCHKGSHTARGTDLPTPRKPAVWGLLPSPGYQLPCTCCHFSGYSVDTAIPGQSSYSRYTPVALELNCVMFSAFQTIYNLTVVHLSFSQWPSSQIIQWHSTLQTIHRYLILSSTEHSSQKDFWFYFPHLHLVHTS